MLTVSYPKFVSYEQCNMHRISVVGPSEKMLLYSTFVFSDPVISKVYCTMDKTKDKISVFFLHIMQNANASSYYVKQSENEVTNKRLLYTKKKVVYELLYVGPHLKFLLIYTHIKQ